MNNILIRKATVADAQQMATLHVKSWQITYKGQVPDSYLENLFIEDRKKKFEEYIKNENIYGNEHFVISLNDQIVGNLIVGKNRDEDLNNTFGELWGIYIHPDYFWKGFGSQLMTYAIEYLKNKGYKNATLWVLDTNKKTRDWYEHKGWKVEGKTKVEKKEGFNLNEIRYIIDL
ncbi:MAG: GNAT family N-acetyltransferase [bacterium]